MAGIFQEVVTLFNRAPIDLNVRFDGQDLTLKPGKNHGVPKIVVSLAKSQNPVMGTEEWTDPTSYRSLIGVLDSKDNCKPLTKEEWAEHLGKPQRYNRETMERDERTHDVVRGKKKKSAFEARYAISEDGGIFGENTPT